MKKYEPLRRYPWQKNDFHFLTLLMSGETRERFVREIEQNRDDVHDWLPGEFTDGPFLGELCRRDTWRDVLRSTIDARGGQGARQYEVVKPTVSYHWESHLDKSLVDGFSRQVPIPWLIKELNLTSDTDNIGTFADAAGTAIIVCGAVESAAGYACPYEWLHASIRTSLEKTPDTPQPDT